MARQTAAKAPARARRERGATVTQVLEALRLLGEKPRTPSDLMELLGISRPTVHRLLNAIEAAGLKLEAEHDSRFVYYSLPRDVLRKKLGV